jgi:L-ascorbate metabolism protein UlaG (beta-lactamase superfamily)
MKIKKIGHCCLVIDTGKVRILTDPGAFTINSHKDVVGIDIILITHEHADHLHVDSLKKIIINNPTAKVITNSSVGKLIAEEGIGYEILEDKDTKEYLNTPIEAHDAKHAEIFEEVGQVQNTGYFIDSKLFYPGDAYCDPGKEVDILALPVAGPWCKIPDAIRYALHLKPNKVFPVHDGMLQTERIGGSHAIPTRVLKENGIEFIPMIDGDEEEL